MVVIATPSSSINALPVLISQNSIPGPSLAMSAAWHAVASVLISSGLHIFLKCLPTSVYAELFVDCNKPAVLSGDSIFKFPRKNTKSLTSNQQAIHSDGDRCVQMTDISNSSSRSLSLCDTQQGTEKCEAGGKAVQDSMCDRAEMGVIPQKGPVQRSFEAFRFKNSASPVVFTSSMALAAGVSAALYDVSLELSRFCCFGSLVQAFTECGCRAGLANR